MCTFHHVLAIVTSMFVLTGIYGQGQVLSPHARLLRSDMEAARDDRHALRGLATLYDLELRDGQWYAGATALVDEGLLDERQLAEAGGRINSRLRGLVTLRFPVARLEQIAAVPGIRYLSMGATASPDLQHSRRDTRADSVNAGLGGLPMGYTGAGVVVAVIDWGFDYTHPVFRDSVFNTLRISRAWDQNKLAGPAPDGYDHGTEYVGMDALLAAGADTTYVFGPMSHGTHVAGIAAGNGAGTTHVGMAPDAELVLVSLRRTDNSFIDAITYIRDHAQSVGKPFVVNMSFGSHQGPHDGSDLRNLAMDQMAGSGRIFVGSAGNNGTSSFHLKWPGASLDDTLRTVVNFGSVADYWGQSVAIWGAPGGSFSVGLKITDGSNNTVHETTFHATADDPLVNDTIVFAPGDTIYMRLVGEAASPLNDRPNALLEVRRTVSWKVVLQLAAEGGPVHLWNVMRLNARTTNWGANFASNYPGAVSGDDAYGLGEPAGVGSSVITVSSHRAEQVNGAGNPIYGALSSYSSRGPTVDERMKPDICAPGQSVRSSVNSFDPNTAGAPQTVSFFGIDYPFDTYSGTSMSSPAVAGVVALMLQANPWLSASEVKQILRGTARLDNHTGPIGAEGDLSWGWGKVDALAAVLAVTAFVSTPDVDMAPDDVMLFPNPSDDRANVLGMSVERFRVFNAAGQQVMEERLGKAMTAYSLEVGQLPAGSYLVELGNADRTVYLRLVRP